MKISLIFPIHNEAERLEASIQDLKSFFKRFPLDCEVIFVLDPSHDSTELKLVNETKVIRNPKRLGRGKSVLEGLKSATGEVVFVGSIDFSTPLAEYFNVLQEFVINPETQFVVGNRLGKKKKAIGKKNSLSQFFDQVSLERCASLNQQIQDPICPFWAIRHSSLQKILPKLKLSRWYYTPDVLIALQQQNIPIQQLEVQARYSPDTRFRWWMFFA